MSVMAAALASSDSINGKVLGVVVGVLAAVAVLAVLIHMAMSAFFASVRPR